MPEESLPDDLAFLKYHRAAMEASADGIAILDTEGRYLFSNPAHARIYGYGSPRNLLGKSWKSLYPETEISRIEKEVLPFVGDKGRWSGNATGKKTDGSTFLQELSITAFDGGFVRVVRDATERTRAERELRDANSKLQALIRAIPDLVYFKDAEGRHLLVNEAVERLAGLGQEEIQGKTTRELLPPEAAELCARSDREALRSTKPVVVEEEVVFGTGKIIFETVKAPLLDAGGAPMGLVAVSRDITERKRMEEALWESEERLASILDSLDAIVYAADMKTYEILYINRYARELVGDIMGKTCWQVLQKGQDGPCAFCTNDRLIDPDGRPTGVYCWEFQNTVTGRWFLIRDRAIRWRDRGLVRLEIATDITDRKRAEEELGEHRHELETLVEARAGELTEANLRLREEIAERLHVERKLQEALASEKSEKAKTDAIISAIGDGLCIMGRDFLVLYQNDVSRGYIGDIEGQCCYEALRSRQAPCDGCPVVMTFRDGKTHTAERSLATETGMSFFEVTTSALRGEDGEIIAGIEVSRDVTYRKRMESEILRTDKLDSLGILAGGIAHDFNNLLTAIVGNISVARAQLNDNDQALRRLGEAEKACFRARDLTQQLLTFSKGGEPVKKETYITELVKDAAGFALRGSPSRCEFSIPEDLWPVEVDEGQMTQVINNLVINAHQAMPGGGMVRASCENVLVTRYNGLPLADGKYVKITVEDRGAGISKEHLNKIFDPFFTTKQKGSGLGLATSYAIVKKHEGHIAVESVPGAGAAFSVYLPARDSGPVGGNIVSPALRRGTGRILVMDDDPSVREVASQMLAAIGYEVTSVADGEEAIGLYEQAMREGRPFHAVIMDLTVSGGMGGAEAMRRLRQMDPGVKAIISSGYSNDPLMADYRKHNFAAVVSKPYRLLDLSEAVRSAINLKAP